MAGAPPVTITQREWMLLRQLKYELFRDFMTLAEDQGIAVALAKLRHQFRREFPDAPPLRAASNGG